MCLVTVKLGSNRSRYFVSVAKCDHLYKEFL